MGHPDAEAALLVRVAHQYVINVCHDNGVQVPFIDLWCYFLRDHQAGLKAPCGLCHVGQTANVVFGHWVSYYGWLRFCRFSGLEEQLSTVVSLICCNEDCLVSNTHGGLRFGIRCLANSVGSRTQDGVAGCSLRLSVVFAMRC